MSEETMCYVAADPDQLGAAWAALFEANTQKDIDKFCSGEIKDGAVIERVTVERALEMLSAWKSPVKVKK